MESFLPQNLHLALIKLFFNPQVSLQCTPISTCVDRRHLISVSWLFCNIFSCSFPCEIFAWWWLHYSSKRGLFSLSRVPEMYAKCKLVATYVIHSMLLFICYWTPVSSLHSGAAAKGAVSCAKNAIHVATLLHYVTFFVHNWLLLTFLLLLLFEFIFFLTFWREKSEI